MNYIPYVLATTLAFAAFVALSWPRLVTWELRRRSRATAYRAKVTHAQCLHYAPAVPPQEGDTRWRCGLCGRVAPRSWASA